MQPDGREFVLDGQYFFIGLPTGGCESDNIWDSAMRFCGDSDGLWHWRGISTWCSDPYQMRAPQMLVRGNTAHNAWGHFSRTVYGVEFGFRPVLWPVSSDGVFDYSVLEGIPNGTVLRAFALMCGKKPCRTDKPQRYIQGRHIEFSDKFYGDKFLIPWVVFDGKAMAALNLLHSISWDTLSIEGFC